MFVWRVLVSALSLLVLIAGCEDTVKRKSSTKTVVSGLSVNELGVPTTGMPASRHCCGLSGTVSERVTACVEDLPAFTPSREAKKVIKLHGKFGKLLLIGGRLAGRANTIQWDDDERLRALMLKRSEKAAARHLLESGVRAVIVHRDLVGALDRDSRVLSRLVNHDFLEWFQLRYAAGDFLIYTVRKNPAQIALKTGERLLAGFRARLEGRPHSPQIWNPDLVSLIVSIRLQGETLAMRFHSGREIEQVLDALARKLATRWEREVETKGFGRLGDHLAEARLEMQVVMERAPVESRTPWNVFQLWELGVDGVVLQDAGTNPNRNFIAMPGSQAVTRSHRSIDQFLRAAAEAGGWHDRRPWQNSTKRLDIIRTRHFMEADPGGGSVTRLFRGLPQVELSDLTDKRLQQMLIDGAEWWVRNTSPDGESEYKYWPTQNRRSTEYNEVRHILGSRDLTNAWRYKNDDRYLETARRNMDWLLQYAVDWNDPPHATLPAPVKDGLLFRYPDRPTATKIPNQKLGTVAVALMGWIGWAQASGSHEEDDRIRRMATWVLSMQSEDGRFQPYHVPPEHPYHEWVNDIVPGEAALALGMVAEYFGEREWLSFYPKFLDHYIPWFQERARRTNPQGRRPHDTYDNATRLELVQFAPWSVMAGRLYYSLSGDKRAAAFALEVADWMIDNYQWTTEGAPFPDYVGGYYKMPSELPAMQTFCYSEGTAAAYHLAIHFKPEAKQKYARATLEALRFLDVMQFDHRNAYFAPRPKQIHGGIKYAMNENKIRIDYVAHGLSTISQFLDARAEDPDWNLDIREPGNW